MKLNSVDQQVRNQLCRQVLKKVWDQNQNQICNRLEKQIWHVQIWHNQVFNKIFKQIKDNIYET